MNSLPECICGFHLDAKCPRHGVEKPTKQERKRPWWSSLNFATPAQTERKEVWAFIKETFILCQQRTNGYTSCMQCGLKNPKRLDLDHITPTGKGGDWVPANAMLLCRGPGTNDCHGQKHGKPQWSGGNAA